MTDDTTIIPVRQPGSVVMAQMGFFDLSDRYASLDAKKDPLVEINAVVPLDALPERHRRGPSIRPGPADCRDRVTYAVINEHQ